MLKKLFMLTMLIFSFSTFLPAQFEGVIEMKVSITEEGRRQEVSYSMVVKKNLMAATMTGGENSGPGGKFIYRGDKQLLWIVNDQEKNYFEISLNDEVDKTDISDGKKSDDHKPNVKRTGTKETILGYPCEELIIEEEKGTTHLWGTAKLGNFYQDLMKSFGEIGGGRGSEGDRNWEDELAELKLFPLRIVSMEGNIVKQRQEVTTIESKSVPASLFEVPKDYERQAMDLDMNRMMKEMEKGMKEYKEENADDPGTNPDAEKMLQQMREFQEQANDTADGG